MVRHVSGQRLGALVQTSALVRLVSGQRTGALVLTSALVLLASDLLLHLFPGGARFNARLHVVFPKRVQPRVLD